MWRTCFNLKRGKFLHVLYVDLYIGVLAFHRMVYSVFTLGERRVDVYEFKAKFPQCFPIIERYPLRDDIPDWMHLTSLHLSAAKLLQDTRTPSIVDPIHFRCPEKMSREDVQRSYQSYMFCIRRWPCPLLAINQTKAEPFLPTQPTPTFPNALQCPTTTFPALILPQPFSPYARSLSGDAHSS